MIKVLRFLQGMVWLYILGVAGASDSNSISFENVVIRVMIAITLICLLEIIKKATVLMCSGTTLKEFKVVK